MLQLLGAIVVASVFYGLFCWILQVKKSKQFILAGVITWLVCAIIYGLTDIGRFYLTFLIGLLMYLVGAGLWTCLAIYFDKTKKNIKWIVEYIPIGALVACLAFIIWLALFSNAIQSEKHRAVQDAVKDDVATMVLGTRVLFVDYEDYSKINNDVMFAAMGISDRNPFGGVYRIDAYEQNPKYFVVSISGVPSTDCKRLAKYKWKDSVLYNMDKKHFSGAVATPEDCSSSNNVIQIIYF